MAYDDLSDRLRMRQLQARMSFQPPQLEPTAHVQGYDRATGRAIVRVGGSVRLAQPLQTLAAPVGRQVDLNGWRFDYL